jgi:hypothetical protein
MLNRAVISLTLLGLSLSDLTLGRMLWPERNNKAVVLNPRRFGEQNPGITVDIGAACPGQVCGVSQANQSMAFLLQQTHASNKMWEMLSSVSYGSS